MEKFKIVRNSALCLICNEEIKSRTRHDFVKCSCGNVCVDGGKDYLRRSVKDLSKYKDTSVTTGTPDGDT
jgi:hypothetical protein